MADCFIGTSGWNYKDWVGPFYTDDTKSEDMLSKYTNHFNTTEINNSFYSLPTEKTVKSWVDDTPENFTFAVKASRYTTHMKKLKDPKKSTDKFFNAIKPLGKKVGPILFQCPPNWSKNPDRLKEFVKALPDDYRYVFEFRDKSWFDDDIYEILQDRNIALCFYDMQQYQSPQVITADFIYMRLHGPEKEAYKGSYDGRTLSGYAKDINKWNKDGKDVYCYFDNDQKSKAPHDAAALIEKL